MLKNFATAGLTALLLSLNLPIGSLNADEEPPVQPFICGDGNEYLTCCASSTAIGRTPYERPIAGSFGSQVSPQSRTLIDTIEGVL
jgi:hypothetical protein